jgi:hypothetical protein
MCLHMIPFYAVLFRCVFFSSFIPLILFFCCIHPTSHCSSKHKFHIPHGFLVSVYIYPGSFFHFWSSVFHFPFSLFLWIINALVGIDISLPHTRFNRPHLLPPTSSSTVDLIGASIFFLIPSLAQQTKSNQPINQPNCLDMHFPSIHDTTKPYSSSNIIGSSLNTLFIIIELTL